MRSRLGWDGLGWVGGGGTACFPKKAFGCFFFFMIHIFFLCLSWWPSSVCHNPWSESFPENSLFMMSLRHLEKRGTTRAAEPRCEEGGGGRGRAHFIRSDNGVRGGPEAAPHAGPRGDVQGAAEEPTPPPPRPRRENKPTKRRPRPLVVARAQENGLGLEVPGDRGLLVVVILFLFRSQVP